MTTLNKLIIYLVLITFTAGCSTMQPLSSTDLTTVASQVSAGDKVEITRTDGETLKFKVSEISDNGITGDDIFVAYTDILKIKVQQSSNNRKSNILIVALTAVGVLMLIGLALEDAHVGYPAY